MSLPRTRICPCLTIRISIRAGWLPYFYAAGGAHQGQHPVFLQRERDIMQYLFLSVGKGDISELHLWGTAGFG